MGISVIKIQVFLISSYLNNWNSYTGETTSYWDGCLHGCSTSSSIINFVTKINDYFRYWQFNNTQLIKHLHIIVHHFNIMHTPSRWNVTTREYHINMSPSTQHVQTRSWNLKFDRHLSSTIACDISEQYGNLALILLVKVSPCNWNMHWLSKKRGGGGVFVIWLMICIVKILCFHHCIHRCLICSG